MHWIKHLYLGESVKKNASLIKYKIMIGKKSGKYYCILLPPGGDMPEIIRVSYLKQLYYQHMDVTVIGLAGDKAEALEVLKDIIDETWQQTKQVNVRRYLAIK